MSQINLRGSSTSRDYYIVVCQPLIVDTPSLSTVAFSQAGSILLAENFNPAVRWTLVFGLSYFNPFLNSSLGSDL